ncbi:MAG: helix-turn-helix transcriptional regulator [Rhodomicrobium sp.]
MDEPASTKNQVLALLRYRPMTVQEMTVRVGITRNAVIVALQDLEAKGLIRRGGAERTGRAGKPAFHYEIIAESFERISPAYQAISPHLLKAGVQDGDAAAKRFLTSTGRSMHAELTAHLKITGRAGLENTLNFLSSQGAEIEIVPSGQDRIVVSHSCPIGVLVRTDRRICSAIATLLSEATGLEVRDECIYAEKLTCRFRLCTPDGAAQAEGR